jgi:hypothetical protein
MQNGSGNPPRRETWLSIRTPGCVIFLFSAAAAYVFIVRPLQDMLARKEYVSYAMEGVAVSVAGAAFGLFYAVLGPRVLQRLLGSPNKLVSRFWAVFLISVFLVIIALAVATWSALVGWLGYA